MQPDSRVGRQIERHLKADREEERGKDKMTQGDFSITVNNV